ncbi:hypothetical protein [Actinoplanes sp. NPDC049316]|uniref:hypothetical protein n=1 Tax=Actinoplanes sp. NPDC049316 TaxID=3154727 RepID=UPI003417C914
MQLLKCGQVLCALMLGIHPAHYVTYQGLPDAAPQAAVASGATTLDRQKLPSRFDSEERQEPAPQLQREPGTAERLRVTQTLDVRWRVEAADVPGRFDSEEPPRETEYTSAALGSSGGAAGGPSVPRPATIRGKVHIPDMVPGPDRKAFDSEERPRDLEEPASSVGSSSGGNDIRVYPESAQASWTAYDATVVTRDYA